MGMSGPRRRRRVDLDRVIRDIEDRLVLVNGEISRLQRERGELVDLYRRMHGLRAALDTNEGGQGCNPDRLGLAS